MTILRGQTPALHAAEMEHLGDEITYSPNGVGPRTFNAWVEFDTEHFRSAGSAATKQVPLVEVLATDVPNPKAAVDRIAIAMLPGLLFTPADVRRGLSGETWVLPLKQVQA